MELFLFYNFAVFAVLGALGLVLFKLPLHSALSFILCLVSVAGLYLLLNAKTLFLIQIVVYAGAIMVLAVFIMMFFNIKEKSTFIKPRLAHLFLAVPVGALVWICADLFRAKKLEFSGELSQNFGEIKELGFYLFSNFGVSFEMISVLLTAVLIAVVGITSAKKESKNV